MDPKSLPIRQYAKEIIDSVRANPVTVVIGETGSGKTTQISQILLEAGFAEEGMIGVTQPRRVAAVMVSRRVAQERSVELGQEVGYAVRFEDRTNRSTKIKYLTGTKKWLELHLFCKPHREYLIFIQVFTL